MVETNSFGAFAVPLGEYAIPERAHEISLASARVAREVADGYGGFVAGSMGPGTKSPSLGQIGFVELRDAYEVMARALIEGGVDLILIETIFDTLNAKAAVYAVECLRDEGLAVPPMMISGTITDLSGRTLTGQTPEAFWVSMSHARPFSVGLNCALGAAEMRQHVRALGQVADTRVSAYPNAGLPNEMGGYDETPDETAKHLGEWADAGLVNLVGGCCGTTPEHICAIAAAVAGKAPRKIPPRAEILRLSGLEMFEAREDKSESVAA